MINKLKSYLLFSFLLGSLISSAQQQDFIIPLNGDTLWGKIKLTTRTQKLTFKTAGTKVNFSPKTLLSFGRYNKKDHTHTLYEAVNLGNTRKVFLKVLAAGKLKLFEESRVIGGRRITYVQTLYYVGKTANSLNLIVPTYYEALMCHLTQDIPHISEKIKESTFYDIPDLVKKFNYATR